MYLHSTQLLRLNITSDFIENIRANSKYISNQIFYLDRGMFFYAKRVGTLCYS